MEDTGFRETPGRKAVQFGEAGTSGPLVRCFSIGPAGPHVSPLDCEVTRLNIHGRPPPPQGGSLPPTSPCVRLSQNSAEFGLATWDGKS